MSLSPRQKQIAQLIWQGLTSREIAAQLCIAVRTVEAHRLSAYQKTHSHNTAQFLRYCVSMKVVR